MQPPKLDSPAAAADAKHTTIMTAVEVFKSAVIRIRDILRGPGVSITGMDSMRHICLYLMSRYMTRAKVESLEVPAGFAWETLYETVQTKNGGVQKALDCFYHPEEDCLVRHFDRLFGTSKFSFDIKTPQKHKEILEILNDVKMEAVDCQMDILGWVYEQHLRTGSSAARDLGQFFTDRSICEYMAELCKPGFKAPGVPESICDPTMGTGGFLTAFVKFYKKHHADKPIDWSIQQKEIHGCDTDPKVAGVARLNLFMETGGNRSTNLYEKDSLYGDLTQTQYDIILANMPFGLKGITHAECCERVKALKIRGTKSEPLFLQLMMVSLAVGGRCAVVVPDGMLANSSVIHVETRKYLLDHFELKRVIKMKGQYFMNTTIQPSILFFENTGKPTAAVEFWEVMQGDPDPAAAVISVPRASIDAACSFDVRRYLEVAPAANPAGYPMVKLGDILVGVKGTQTLTLEKAMPGSFPLYSASVDIRSHTEPGFDGQESIIQACVGSNLVNCIHYVNRPFASTANLWVLRKKEPADYELKFVYYWLLLTKTVLKKVNVSVLPKINKKDFDEIVMPLPPVAVQREIIAALDRIYSPGTLELADSIRLTDAAAPAEVQELVRKSAQLVMGVRAQMAADVRAQMAAIMKSVAVRGFDTVRLCDILTDHPVRAAVSMSSADGGEFSLFSSSCDVFKHSVAEFTGQPYLLQGSRGTISKATHYCETPFSASNNVFVLSATVPELVSLKFVYYFLRLNNIADQTATTSVIPMLTKKMFSEITMPMPPVAFQKAVLSRLETLQVQLDAVESLHRQSEDNARFILEAYLPA